MSQKPSPPFWIPGGVLLLVFCILASALQSFVGGHVHSDLWQHFILAADWILRAVAVGGIVCIVIGIVVAIRRKQTD